MNIWNLVPPALMYMSTILFFKMQLVVTFYISSLYFFPVKHYILGEA